MDTYVYRFDQQMTYEVVPRIDTMVCFETPGAGQLTTLLPDLSSWTYMGVETHHGQKVQVWQDLAHDENKTNSYKMYRT